MRRFEQAQRSHAQRARRLYDADGEAAGLRSSQYSPETGRCVDEGGIAAVRPYLVAHEHGQRERGRSRAVPPEPCQEVLAPQVPTKTSGGIPPDDMRDLAALVRQWQALRQPVA